MAWCFDWCRVWDLKLTSASATVADAMNQDGDGELGARFGVEFKLCWLVQVNKDACLGSIIEAHGNLLFTYRFTNTPPRNLQRKWKWASSVPLALLPIHHVLSACTPLFGAFLECWAQGAQSQLHCMHPPVLWISLAEQKPMIGSTGSPLTWIPFTHPTWPLHPLFHFICFILFYFLFYISIRLIRFLVKLG